MTTKQTDKLRYMYLGKTPNNKVIILESDLSPEQIVTRNELGVLVKESFTYYATNWGGCDDINTVCRFKKIKTTNAIMLNEPFIFYGSDYDWGHEYDWNVVVDEIDTIQDI